MHLQWITTQQAAEKWDVSLRYAQRLLSEGRVPNVKKYGRSWMIPFNAKKPNVLPKERLKKETAIPACFSLLWEGFLPEQEFDTALQTLENHALRNQCLSEIAYLRGDFDQTKRLAAEAMCSEPLCIGASLFSIFAAMSTNDFELYSQVELLLKERLGIIDDYHTALLAEIVLATGAVCMFAPEMVPDWLKEGRFSHLPKEAVSFALYLRVKYLQNIADFPQMFAVAHTMFTIDNGKSVTRDIYLLLMCAVACGGIGQKERSRKFLLEALALGMPHRFITPFAENVSPLNGLMEECVKQDYPYAYDALIAQWQKTWKNWAVFHNRFARDNVPLILSRREYRIATLAATRTPYAKIAEQECISAGRVRNIMQEIYGKLFVRNRDELAALVLWTPKKT